MAQRRMFSQRITNSGRFLQMSQSAQALYFHLGMRADDDGVVEAYPVMKLVNAAEDDFKVLIAKGFIKPLNEDLVAFIIDWNEHNLIRADRKVDSIYKDLLMKIVPEIELMTPAPRADTGVIPRGNRTGRPVAVNGPHRLGKVRLGKERIQESSLESLEPSPSDESRNFFSKGENYRKTVVWLKEKGIEEKQINQELDKFIGYWTEKNSTGKKEKWQMEKTFEVRRRLATWLSRVKEFSGSSYRKYEDIQEVDRFAANKKTS